VPCGAAFGPACASPPALPRTSLPAGPPGPDSPALLVCLPCGAAFSFRLQPCLRSASRPTLGTCIRLSLPVPALRRCLRLGLRLASSPASIWSPARAFSSTSGLNLQLLTVRRFSGCRRALVRTRVLQPPPCGFGLFPGPSVSPSVQSRDCSRGLRSQAGLPLRAFAPRLRSTLLPPSGSGARPGARALRLLPFLPASLLACLSPALRLSPVRLRCEAALWHAFDPPSPWAFTLGSVWPSRWFPELALLLQHSGNRPLVCASADCSGLAVLASCGCQLPAACGPPGSRSVSGLRLLRIRPLACSCLRSACASRRSGAGLSVLPRRPRYR